MPTQCMLFMVALLIFPGTFVFPPGNGRDGPTQLSQISSGRDALSTTDSLATVADEDSDGVPDSLDLCHNTPSLIIVNESGCADTSRILARRIMPGLFPSGGTSLKYADPTQLDSIVVFLRLFESATAIIYGHTDNLGIDEKNLIVSQERAEEVQRYLALQGISVDRLLSIGRGETMPVASNETRAGRRMNRRIEIEFRL